MTQEQTTFEVSNNPYHVALEIFEGPLDLLLHLIKENNIDIFNIPISQITDQYIQYIHTMQSLNLDIAGEFLLMASTLAHLKSKMLLPPDPTEEEEMEEGQDPREELVRRLLEYQKYKNAASQLDETIQLDRDTFIRDVKTKKLHPDEPVDLAEISVFKLVESFHRILDHLHIDHSHDVETDQFSIADSATFIQERIKRSSREKMTFTELFSNKKKPSYGEVVACFLAVLAMMKRGVLKVIQTTDFEDIYLMPTESFYQGAWTYDGTEFDETNTN